MEVSRLLARGVNDNRDIGGEDDLENLTMRPEALSEAVVRTKRPRIWGQLQRLQRRNDRPEKLVTMTEV